MESNLCTIYYSSLNFRDVMLATGKLPRSIVPLVMTPEDCVIGFEFSGRDAKGRRIMGITPSKGLATSIIINSDCISEVPDTWTLEEAATVPVAYTTSYYALIVRGHMEAGESVLIHAGTGAVGQAAISIALQMGCEVFTTVSTPAKRDFLLKTFPQLVTENIGNSRDTSFEQLVQNRTQGRGVDLVLNSLAGDQLHASVHCLGFGGRFLEIGKVDLIEDSQLRMSLFEANTVFHGVQLDVLMVKKRGEFKEAWRLVREGIANGAVRPLNTTVYAEREVEQAFRFLGSGTHIGKVLIKMRDEEDDKVLHPRPKVIRAITRTYMHLDKSYIIVGGLGGFGLELTKWLVMRGARKVVLNSRSGIQTGYQYLCIRRWRGSGVDVVISTEDFTTEKGARQLLQQATNLGPVGGIFNLALVLRDALLENQTEANFKTVCQPKIDGTKQLDALSRDLAPHLDHFVCFSSVCSGRGQEGQSNYGFASSGMERICQKRKQMGLPGLAIQWGVVGDVGFLGNAGDGFRIKNVTAQSISSCMTTLDLFMQQSEAVVSSMVLSQKQHSCLDDQFDLVTTVAIILGVKDVSKVSATMTLTELGIDSIMTTEIKQTLERQYDLLLSIQDIRTLTFEQLRKLSKSNSTPSHVQSIIQSNIPSFFRKLTELVPCKTVRQMDSKTASDKPPVFVIHPAEGSVEPLEPLAKNIEATVYGLQFTEDAPLGDMSDLAAYYLTQIKTMQPDGPYTFIGYSFGASVAFEMALQLEKQKEEVKLLLVDGAPSYGREYAVQLMALADVQQGSTGYLAGNLTLFILQFLDVKINKVMAELESLETIDAMVARTADIISEKVQFPKNQIETAARQFLFKLPLCEKYEPSATFGGDITLIKAKENIQPQEDYGLSRFCRQVVSIYTLEGNHVTILEEPSLSVMSDIINKILKTT